MSGSDDLPAGDLFGSPATRQDPVVGYAQVAPERGVDLGEGGLTYAIPGTLADLAVGERVLVTLGRSAKPVAGFVLGVSETCPMGPGKAVRIKPVLGRDPRGGSLPEDLVNVARWIAAYYLCPLGMVFATMLPAAVKRGTGATRRMQVCLQAGSGVPAKLSKLQQAVVEALRRERGRGCPWVDLKTAADLAGARSVAPVRALVDRGLVRSREVMVVVSDLDLRAQRQAEAVTPPVLSGQQAEAMRRLDGHLGGGFSVHLLHGVTGSGKTEVYLRAIERVLGTGGDAAGEGAPSAIVLVPEIALTPQTVGRFLGRFPPDLVAVLHSGLTAAQRHVQWQRIRQGEARIVVGARSAVFAPLANLRLIIVDEEHESSYKQDQLPRYHARDVAVRRAQLLKIPVILGSATPSLESYHNATGRSTVSGPPPYQLLAMPDRVPGMRLPVVQVVDMKQERRFRRGVHLLSRAMERELAGLRAGEAGGDPEAPATRQAILLLNRRGYANHIACPDHGCGWMMTCDHCDVTMVYHLLRGGAGPGDRLADDLTPRPGPAGVVRCHHCSAEQVLAQHCPDCGKKTSIFGLGTQRVEEELARKFPGLRAIRMDSDAMRTARHYQEALDRFRAGGAEVLLGTQMIAKGLDFPGVRLVGVISADTALHLPDFRAAERTFQLISQVAGRSGRSAEPGKVVVQTFDAGNPVIGLAARHDYTGFAQQELALRAEVGLPPVTRMARIVVRDRDYTKAVAEAKRLAAALDACNRSLELGVRLRGPAPCALSRVADHHRQQVELLAPDAVTLQKLMTALRNARMLTSDAHTAVDVDPVALL